MTEMSHAGDLSVGSDIGGHLATIGRVLEAPRMLPRPTSQTPLCKASAHLSTESLNEGGRRELGEQYKVETQGRLWVIAVS